MAGRFAAWGWPPAYGGLGVAGRFAAWEEAPARVFAVSRVLLCMGPRDHRSLEVFHLADGLVVAVYAATRTFPADEVFGLRSQVRRAAVSVAANIVEGCGSSSNREYLRFLRCGFASLREVGYFIDLARRLGYLDESQVGGLWTRQRRTAAALRALIRSVVV